MFINQVSIEKWEGNRSQETVKQGAGWEEVEAIIKDLGQSEEVLLSLQLLTDDSVEEYMAVARSGNDYLVHIGHADMSFHTLVDPSKPQKERIAVVGGQEGFYPGTYYVSLEAALEAAKEFAEHGTVAESRTWEAE